MKPYPAVLTFEILSACVFAQQAPMAIYHAPQQKTNHTQAVRLAPGYSVREQQPTPSYLSPLTDTEKHADPARGLTRVGLRRSVPVQVLSAATVLTMPDGRRLWRVTIGSPEAEALRVHFVRFAAESGQVWVYAPQRDGEPTQVQGPYSRKGPFADGNFWSSAVQGETVTVEYLESTPGSASVLPPFEIDSVVHLWDPGIQSGSTPNAAGYCHLDVSCYANYQDMAKAVVQFDYVGDDGSAYVCSGAMINTRNRSFKPYLLTAHHCIGSDAEARSMTARFFYQTSSCNAMPPNISSVPTVNGARYLVGAPIAEGDYSLVLLNQAVPDGTWFLGWNATGPNVGEPALGIHHPAGSWRRISFGNRGADRSAVVEGESAPADRYYLMDWTQGRTEGGSSGSPLLNSQGQILGTLTYGPRPRPGDTICDVEPNGGYGRFSNAYSGIRNYLEDTAAPSIAVTPLSLAFTAVNGQYAGAAERTLTISTQSATPVSFSLTASTPWIRLSRTSGTVSASAPMDLGVSIDLSYVSRSANVSGTVIVSSGTLTPISVSVQASVTVSFSKVTVSVSPNPVYEHTPDVDGYSWSYTVTLAESGGVATRITGLKIDGTDYSRNITSWFGSDQLAAGGTRAASLRSKGVTAPTNRVFEASGADITGRTWITQVAIPFVARPKNAIVTLDSAPSLIRANPNSTECPWHQQLVLQEMGGFSATLNRFIADGTDLSSQIASYWTSTQLPANGALRAGICWTGVQPPQTLSIEVGGVDASGGSFTARVSALFTGPAASPTTLSVTPGSAALAAPANSATPVSSSIALKLGSPSAFWTARIVVPKPPATWLSVSPLSGTGSTSVTVTASPSGLASGVYDATLVIQSIEAIPQLINVPLKLTVGASAGAPVIDPAGVVNNAMYQPAVAPGTVLSVFGQGLALGTAQAWTLPLPHTMQGVTATINGRPTPFYYVSPTQLNLQVPYETEVGTATLIVTVNGQSATQRFQVSNTAPGIYTADGRNVVPVNEASRTGYLTLFITGQGALNPPMGNGVAPPTSTPVEDLPSPIAPLSVTVGGVPARVTFGAIPYYLVGVMQINCLLAAGTPQGVQPVVVRVGDRLSPPAYVFVK